MIVELKSEDEWQKSFNCIKHLRPSLSETTLLKGRKSLIERDFHLLGYIESSEIIGVASYIIHPHLERGNEFWIHDLVTLPNARNRGVSKELINYMELSAGKRGCSRIVLHTRIERNLTENYYQKKLGYNKYAVVLTKETRS